MKLKIVTTKQLCTACHIIEGVVRQMMDKLLTDIDDVETIWHVYDTMEEAFDHPMLEIPKFPAIFIDDEQMTAGEIPSREDILYWVSYNNKDN